MVQPMTGSGVRQKTPRIVEIVGVAGAGKTTLCRTLNRYSDHISLGHFPNVRKVADAPFFVYYGLQLVPSLLYLYQGRSSWLTRREFAWLTILSGWPRRLQLTQRDGDKVIVLDQGPVYLLAETNELGPECLRSPKADRFWKNIYLRWTAVLDMVIWLEADNACLLERIQTRPKGHVVKSESASTAFQFLESYRVAYEHIFCMLKANKEGPRVIQFNTGEQQPEEIADRLLIEFGRRDGKDETAN
jgi:deoxyadenosine/deoxycytidine kinase